MSRDASVPVPVDKLRPLPGDWMQARLDLDPADPLLAGAPYSLLLLARLGGTHARA